MRSSRNGRPNIGAGSETFASPSLGLDTMGWEVEMIDPNNLPKSSLQTGIDRTHLNRLLIAVFGLLGVLLVVVLVLMIIG